MGVAYTNNFTEDETSLTFEERYFKKYKQTEEREKLQSNAKDSGPKECMLSIPGAINKLIQRDAEQLIEHLKQKHRGKFAAVDCEINLKDLLMITAEGTYVASHTKSTRANEPIRRAQIDEEEPANEPVEDQDDSDFDMSNDEVGDFSAPQPYSLRTRRKNRRAIQIDEMDEEDDDESAQTQQQYHTRSRNDRANPNDRNDQTAVPTRTRGRRTRIRFDDDDENNNENEGLDSVQEENKTQQSAAPQSSARFIRAAVPANTRLNTRPSVAEPTDTNPQNDAPANGEQTVARRRPLRPQPLQRDAIRNENLMEIETSSQANRRPAPVEETEDLRATRRRTLRQQPVYREMSIEPEEPIRATRRTALLNEFDTNATERFDPQAAGTALTQCTRCMDENARVKCENCAKCYHQKCSKLRGSQTATSITRSSYLCFECQFKNRKTKKEVSNFTQVARTWASYDTIEGSFYAPQVGDRVYYIFQAHEEFVSKYFSNLNFDEAEEINPVEQFHELATEVECEITSVKYEFPISVKRVKSSDIPCIVSCLTLTIPDTGNSFKARYFPLDGNDLLQFLIPKNKYEKAMALFKNVRVNTTLNVMCNGGPKKLFVSEISPKESNQFSYANYKSIKVHDLNESSYHLRHARAEDMEGAIDSISPWDLINNIPYNDLLEANKDMNGAFLEKLSKDFQRLCEENIIFEPFYEEVDQRTYSDYELFVPVPMSVSKILVRIQNNYYRSKQAIVSDAQMIAYNASQYNLPDSEITMAGKALSENIQNIVFGNYEKSLLNVTSNRSDIVGTRTRSRHHTNGQSTQPIPTRSHRHSLRIEEDEEEEPDKMERVKPRRGSRAVIQEEEEEDFEYEADYNSGLKDTKVIIPNITENQEGRRLTRSAVSHNTPRPQENRLAVRESASRANTREGLRESPREEQKTQEDALGVTRTRSGRTVVYENALRHTGGVHTAIKSSEMEEVPKQTRPATRNEIRPPVQQQTEAEENEVPQRRLRARKSESMKLIDYEFEDFEEDDDKYQYSVATRKKVKTAGSSMPQDQYEIAEEMDTMDGFERETLESQQRNGRETRTSSRLKKPSNVQEERQMHNLREQQHPESNPLEQNLGGVRTRSRR